MTAYQYNAEQPGSNLVSVLNKGKDFATAFFAIDNAAHVGRGLLRRGCETKDSRYPGGLIIAIEAPDMTLKTKATFDPKIFAALGDGVTLSDYRLEAK